MVLNDVLRSVFRPVPLLGGASLVLAFLYVLMFWMPGNPEGVLRTTPVDDVSRRLGDRIRVLAEEIGERTHTTGLRKSEDYLRRELTERGLSYEEQTFRVDGVSHEFRNFIVEIAGTSRAREIVVVGAHYDTAEGTPGADDNASGVASLFELVDVFRHTKPQRTLRFVFFTTEEPPFFRSENMGSFQYAKRCSDRGDDVVAMLSLESMGYFDEDENSQKYPFGLGVLYPSTGNFITFVGNIRSGFLVRDVISVFRRTSDVVSDGGAILGTLPGIYWSDHWSFWQHGYPAIMVTDTAPFRNPHYHEASDRAASIDVDKLARVVLGLTSVVSHLAQVDPKVDDQRP